jgi:FkbM family methyltransferase
VNYYELRIIESVALESPKVIIDVGARTDIFFARLRCYECRVFHIEGSKYFHRILKIKLIFLGLFNDSVSISNFFVSQQNAETSVYYPKSQSLYRNVMLPQDKPRVLNVRQMRLDSFCTAMDINQIDFIKFDIEGGDYCGLVSLGNYIEKCKYIQFELGVKQSWLGISLTSSMYLDLLKPSFSLYLVRDDRNPFFDSMHESVDLIEFNIKALQVVEKFQDRMFGFNCFGISKQFNLKVPQGLKVATL